MPGEDTESCRTMAFPMKEMGCGVARDGAERWRGQGRRVAMGRRCRASWVMLVVVVAMFGGVASGNEMVESLCESDGGGGACGAGRRLLSQSSCAEGEDCLCLPG